MEILNPAIAGDSTYTPFYFDPANKYYFDQDEFDRGGAYVRNYYQSLGKAKNLKSWVDQYGGYIYSPNPKKDIEEVIYGIGLDRKLNLLPPPGINFFYGFLNCNPKVKQYVRFAKRCSHYLQKVDPWEKHQWPNIQSLNTLIKRGKRHYQETANTFLKNRYAYQLVVLARYSKQFEKLDKFIEQYLEPLNKRNHLYYWALHHRAYASAAGPYNATSGNVAAVQAFLNAPSKKVRAWLYYEPDAKYTNPDYLLGYSKNLDWSVRDKNRLAAGVALLEGLGEPGPQLDKLKLMYQYEPQFEPLKMMMVKELNKLTDWIYSKEYTAYIHVEHPGIKETHLKKDKAKLSEYRAFLEVMLEDNLIEDRAFYQLLYGHCLFIQKQYGKAFQVLKRINPAALSNEKQQIQLRKSQFLSSLYAEKIAKSTDKKVNRLIQWYRKQSSKLMNFRNKLRYLLLFTGKAYEKDGYWGKACLFYHYADKQLGLRGLPYFEHLDQSGSIKSIEDLLVILKANHRNSLEDFLLKDNEFNFPEILDLKGTKYFRKNQLRHALAVFEKIPEQYWKTQRQYKRDNNELYFNKFATRLFACGEDSLFTLPKDEIINRLLNYKQKIQQTAGYDAIYYLKLGVMYQHFSYYGHTWWMYQFEKGRNYSGSLVLKRKPNPNIVYHANYFGLAKSRAYYKKGLNKASDKRIKALLHRLLIECERANHFYQEAIKRYKFGNQSIVNYPPKGPLKLGRKGTHSHQILKSEFPELFKEFIHSNGKNKFYYRDIRASQIKPQLNFDEICKTPSE